MKLYDINGKLVNVDIKQSSYPIKNFSKSKLQGEVGKFLQEKFYHFSILEEFPIPNSRLKCDFFIPQQFLVIEVQSKLHTQYIPYFHGNRLSCKYTKQVSNDRQKSEWCEINSFKLIEIFSEDDLKKI